ncbi:hypothetical protein PT974_02288 [Cladobotryum mycophilum]|uniref:Copper transporter n=1 Tax=Cladobotryum mycophilum TaxID=491253 RepID=A0ABR0SXN0_9HYPO
MDKVALLTASRLGPTVKINPHTTLVGRLSSTLSLPIQFRQLHKAHKRLSSVSIFLFFWAYFIAYSILIGTFYASKFLAMHALVATRFGLTRGLSASGKAVVDVWDSKRVQAIRTRLFYEFAVFILGCGNSLILLLFWPGWLFIGGILFALWEFSG